MELEYLGHAAFAVYHARGTLVIDPYESGQFDGRLAYRPIDVAAQWVVCSHEHADHNAVHAVPGAPVRLPEEPQATRAQTTCPFEISRWPLDHDEYGGRRRGGSVDALRVSDGEHTIVHLSDVGQAPCAELIAAWRQPDVLLVPVGGYFTIGAAQAWEWVARFRPKAVVAIHYRTAACTLPMRDETAWVGWSETSTWNSCRFHVHEVAGKSLIVAPRLA